MRLSTFSPAAVAACMLGPFALAQSAPGHDQELRNDIRRIVREELRAALRELHGDATTTKGEAREEHDGAPAPRVQVVHGTGLQTGGLRTSGDGHTFRIVTGDDDGALLKLNGELQELDQVVKAIEGAVAGEKHGKAAKTGTKVQNLRSSVTETDDDADDAPRQHTKVHQLQLQPGVTGAFEWRAAPGKQAGKGKAKAFVLQDGKMQPIELEGDGGTFVIRGENGQYKVEPGNDRTFVIDMTDGKADPDRATVEVKSDCCSGDGACCSTEQTDQKPIEVTVDTKARKPAKTKKAKAVVVAERSMV